MSHSLKEAMTLCNTIMRNGFDAYVINPRLQEEALKGASVAEIDIATECGIDELIKLFPQVLTSDDEAAVAMLKEGGAIYRFYPSEALEGAHPEATVTMVTPRLLRRLAADKDMSLHMACPYLPRETNIYENFQDLALGEVRLLGLPDETLKRNYILAVRAIRFAANFHLPIEANTWMAIIRGARRTLDYVSVSDIMDEWRKVEAENMWHFVQILYDAQILHGLMPEVAALVRVRQTKNEAGEQETVFAHTIEVMRRYPEELPYDWYGALACLFHDVGKLFTADFHGVKWHFHQHHQVGAKVTRKIMKRLRFSAEDIDLVCGLVRNHMRFSFMLTDKGLRRFRALDEFPRLIEMARANIKARGGSYAAFNHNRKTMERLQGQGEAPEALLNGNEIMDFTGIKPGPAVGLIREALLKAQLAGDVTSVPEAVEFVIRHQDRERPGRV